MPRLAKEGRNGEVGEETRQVQRGGAEPKKDMGGYGRREEESTDKGGQGEKERKKRGKLDSSRDKTIANWQGANRHERKNGITGGKKGGAILRTGQYAQAGSRLMCGE